MPQAPRRSTAATACTWPLASRSASSSWVAPAASSVRATRQLRCSCCPCGQRCHQGRTTTAATCRCAIYLASTCHWIGTHSVACWLARLLVRQGALLSCQAAQRSQFTYSYWRLSGIGKSTLPATPPVFQIAWPCNVSRGQRSTGPTGLRVQALRHFYVLAANPRIMRAIDVHERQPVYVPAALTVAAGDALAAEPQAQAPKVGRENVPSNTQPRSMFDRSESPAAAGKGLSTAFGPVLSTSGCLLYTSPSPRD